MTERLYYHDSYLRRFDARVVRAADEGRRVYLDRTAFYPSSGGQPFDRGTLVGIAVEEVIDEDGEIAHVLSAPSAQAVGATVAGVIDWERRFDLMQQHSGQHLLSAQLHELFGMETVSVHMGDEASTIDLNASQLSGSQIEQAEESCARIVAEARPVRVSFEDGTGDLGLRKASARSGTLRVVTIDGADRSACGGTHVRSTAEIGPVMIGKLDKVRGLVRVEFSCGLRALRRARQQGRLLDETARALTAPVRDVPALVAGLIEKNKSLEKSYQKVAVELATREGRDLYHSTAPGAGGARRAIATGPINDAQRARARAFVGEGRSVYLAACENPPSVLLMASPDSGVHAGNALRAAVTAAGGRGGGSPAMAQGSVPDREALEQVIAELGGET